MGDTGTGKSTLLSRLVLRRSDYIVIRTKSDDVKWQGVKVRTAAEVGRDPREPYWILEPRYERQWEELRRVYEMVWKEGSMCVVNDEQFYIDDELRLKRYSTRMLTQGRSKHITMVMGMQRPVAVTRFALSQSSHLIVFQQDDRDAVTIGDAAGGRPFRQEIMSLQRHEFLWYYRPERRWWRGKFDPATDALIETPSRTR